MTPLEPIAIVGMACRFAGGVESLDAFWELLRDEGDVIGDLPPGRWDWYAAQGHEHAAAVRDATSRGAYLTDVAGFDADFFEITPREAALMDPQQRIVLEVAWEALEHAGIAPPDLAGTDTGVFIGVGADDYGRRMLEDLPRIEAWSGVGGAYCGVANRVSYVMDLRGPSVAVDTACSSSLVSIHLAAQALRAGECPVALAGGVLVIAAPGLSIVLDAAGATAPDGRSKSFDAAADGYGRGEGAGLVVLKRLSDARRDGDRVLAVLRGSAVHQDGRTNGIMAPSGEAQTHLMRRACAVAGIDPLTVGYVEAHGTGTRAGDPIEAGALSAVYGSGRGAGRPCLIGSVKPNIGHLEAAAGIAGMIKAVLAMRHGAIPPTVNHTKPNPAIPWDTSGLRVVTEMTPWPDSGEPRRAGVSGYGYGGTIAHLLLEEGDRPAPVTAPPDDLAVYPLSARSEAALRDHAARLAEHIATAPAGTAGVGYTLARRRPHLSHRAAVVAAGRDDLVARLREVADGTGAATGTVLPAAANGVVWVFSGHGSQWTGMARGLLDDPVFAGVLDRLEPIFTAELGRSPRAVILDNARQPIDVIQPMIFAVQAALAEVWRDRGLRPAAVVGHSVGEIAAAVTAGVLSLEDGARLVCRRSVLLRAVAGLGAMAMVDLPAEEVERRLGERADVEVAVIAAPGSVAVSGDVAAVRDVSDRWRAEGVRVRAIHSDVAFHSAHMDPLVAPLADALADLRPGRPSRRLYTTALADPRANAPRDAAYWAANLRGQVRLSAAVTAAVEDGYRLFLEVSPHPVVEHSIVETLDTLGVTDAATAHTLRRNRPERETLLANLALLYSHGAPVDWSTAWPEGPLADLPTTPWRHRPFWLEEPAERAVSTRQHDPAGHTLLGGRTTVHGTTLAHAWLTRLDRRSRPYPGDHPVRDVEIVPAAVLLHTFLAAAAAVGPWPDLSEVDLRVPVSLTRPRDLQVVLQDGALRLTSRIADEAPDDLGWVTHATAVTDTHTDPRARPPMEVDAGTAMPTSHVVDRLASVGVAAMGFPWRISGIRTGDGTIEATVDGGPGPTGAAETWASILDAALSTASVAFAGPQVLRMPAHLGRLALAPTPPARARIAVRVTGADIVDVEILDEDGTVRGRMSTLRYGELDADVDEVVDPRRLIHEIVWRPVEYRPGVPPEVVLVARESALLGQVMSGLREAGVAHRVVPEPEELDPADLTGGHAVLVVPHREKGDDLARSAERGAWLLARTAQRLAGAGKAVPARLWCLTRDVREGASPAGLAHSPLWGMGRVIGGEHPELWGGVIDLGRSAQDVAALIRVIGGAPREDVVAIRDGEPAVPRLRLAEGGPVRPPAACEPDGTYLITGGLGALGLEVAHWLADRGARRIVLAGRTSLPPRDRWDGLTGGWERERVAAVRSLERLGVTVVTVALDIADRSAAARLLSPAALGLPPIRGVVHAAGVLDNRTLATLDEPSLNAVLRPKVGGALALHELFPPGSVDFFVLFSSCGHLLGLPGQASYGAGNAFLDTLAAHRRAAGDAGAVSLGWTSWRGLGMSTSSAVIDVELAARGTTDITSADAFAAWELVDRYGLAHAAVLRTVARQPGDREVPLLSELSTAKPAREARGTTQAPWADLHGHELLAYLTEEIRRQVSAETRLPAAELDPRRPLVEMGIDSVMSVRIRRGMERRFGLALPATLFWDRPTVEAVAAFLTEVLDRDVWPC